MSIASEYLSTLSSRNYRNDFERVFIEKNHALLRFYKRFPSTKFALFLLRLEYHQYYLLEKYLSSKQTYQSVLDSIIDDIKNAISELGLPDVKLTEWADVDGYNVFNAESIPFFGQNYIAINSGIFFFSHVFARTVQPFLVKEDTESRHFPPLILHYLSRCFVKTAVGYLVNDRTKSFLSIRFIPEDDSLLSGMETFICAHECAHLCFRENSQILNESIWNKFSYPLKELIMSNEEIAADAFALVVLRHIQSRTDSETYSLFAPCCLFQLLSQLDDMTGKKENPLASHPSNKMRYKYIHQMIGELLPDNKYEKWEKSVYNLCNNLQPRILRKYNRIHKAYEELSAVYLSYHTPEYYELLR